MAVTRGALHLTELPCPASAHARQPRELIFVPEGLNDSSLA